MDIYWIQDKQRRGPATVPDVIALVQMGELTPDTLGWHEGCPNWRPLRELPALADFLGEMTDKSKGAAPLPPLPPLPAAPPQESTRPVVDLNITINQPANSNINPADVRLPAPWARLAARLVDSSLYAAVAAGLLSLTGLNYNDMLMPLFWLPMVFLEALLLSRHGTTPGKRLMGIAVSTIGSAQQLTFRRALIRSFAVNILGMGCYLFPICVVTISMSYFLLVRRGLAIWDAQSLTLPIQIRKTGIGHYIAAAVIMYIMAQITAFSLLQMPGTLETVEQISPDTAKQLRELMPNLPGSSSHTPPSADTPQPLQ